MITHLLDTSVFSQPVRNARSRVAPAMARWSRLGDARLAVSIVAYAETRLGIELSGSARMRATFTRALDGRLTLLETDQTVWNEFVLMKVRQTRIGQAVNDFDLLIAATALAQTEVRTEIREGAGHKGGADEQLSKRQQDAEDRPVREHHAVDEVFVDAYWVGLGVELENSARSVSCNKKARERMDTVPTGSLGQAIGKKDEAKANAYESDPRRYQ